jgi:uroporphyrinogen-III synthase
MSLYKTTKTDLNEHPAAADFREKGADAVLFTSSSTVKSFVEQAEALKLEPNATKPVFGSIGPLTTKTLKEFELPVDFESVQASLPHFVQATIESLKL